MSQADRTPTPSLDGLLSRLDKRLRRQVFLFGTGRVMVFLFGWLSFMFLADWLLHVPSGVRVLHFLVLIGLPAAFVWRELYRRMQRVPERDGLAVLVERAHPELHELLISAVQLGARPARDGESPELVARVVSEAEERAQEIDLEGTVDPRGPRRSLLWGGVALVTATLLLTWNTAASRIFLARIAGGDTPWPQRTQLFVEIPVSGGRAQVETSPGEIRVRVARGSDVPVVVRAEGQVPDEVMLHFRGGQVSALPATGRATFHETLRSVQEDMSFYVTGGDDTDRLPRVTIRVLQPPDVAGIALVTEPPAYSGLPSEVVHDRDVRVLAGTRVRVHILPDPSNATGVARLLPEDRVVQLEARPYPPRADQAAGASAGSEPLHALSFDLVADADLRYRFELKDDTGLSNPDPGLFAIEVIEDRPPEVEVLSPGRVETETVIGGEIPLRIRALDDFGLATLELAVGDPGLAIERAGAGTGDSGTPDARLRTSELSFSEIEIPERDAQRMRKAVFASRRLTLEELAGEDSVVEGQLFQLEVIATDVRDPNPQEGRSLSLRVRVVSADEFLRRIQDRLSRARIDVGVLADLIAERRRRTLELVAALESDQPGIDLDASEVAAAISGQRRVQGDARALARELGSVTEDLVYSRLDDRAGALLEELDGRNARITDRGFHPELWEGLAKQDSTGVGGSAFATRLVEIVELALEISEQDSNLASEALRRAEAADDLTLAHEALLDAADSQAAAHVKTDRLLELLAEWDNFQSVLSLTREILNRQKNLLERTRQYAKEN